MQLFQTFQGLVRDSFLSLSLLSTVAVAHWRHASMLATLPFAAVTLEDKEARPSTPLLPHLPPSLFPPWFLDRLGEKLVP